MLTESSDLTSCPTTGDGQAEVNSRSGGSGSSAGTTLVTLLSVGAVLLVLTVFLIVVFVRKADPKEEVPAPVSASPSVFGPPPTGFKRSGPVLQSGSKLDKTQSNPVFNILDGNYSGKTLVKNPSMDILPGPAYFEVSDDEVSDDSSDASSIPGPAPMRSKANLVRG